MTGLLNKVENTQSIVFDALLMELAQMKEGDEMDVEIYEGGTLMLRPIRRREIFFDPVLMKMADLQTGDELDVDVDDAGTLTLTPIRQGPSYVEVLQVIRSTMKDYAQTMKQLA